MSSNSVEDIRQSEFVHILAGHDGDLRSKLYQQWQDGSMCDLLVSLKGGNLHAHSCVLAAFSPKLKVLVEGLSSASASESKKSLRLPFSMRVFRCLLNMMYTGVLSFSTALLSAVLSAARWLRMEEVVNLCEEYKQVLGDAFDESLLEEDTVLTETDHDIEEENGFVNAPAIQDGSPEAKVSSGSKKCGRKRCCCKASKPSPRKPKKKSGGDWNSGASLVTVKVEPEEYAGDPRMVISDPNISNDEAVSGSPPLKRKRGRPKKKRAENPEACTSSGNLETDSLTKATIENAVEESIKSLFGDPSSMPFLQLVETRGSESKFDKEVMDFTLGKLDHIRCRKCHSKFRDVDKYFSHVADHPSFKCDHCEVTCARLSNLTRHVRTYHSDRQYLRCKKCEFFGETESALLKHFKENHGGEKPFSCDHPGCEFTCWKSDFLRRHSQIHSEVKGFMCAKCGQGFSQHAGLMSHSLSCYRQQQFLCDLCGQAFNHLQSMRSHRRTVHFGEKPHLCKVCGSQFGDQRNLKRHMRIHENSFPYECPICRRGYRHSNSLKGHLKTHERNGYDISGVNVHACMCVGRKEGGGVGEESKRAAEDVVVGGMNNIGAAFQGFLCTQSEQSGVRTTVADTVFPGQMIPSSYAFEPPTNFLSAGLAKL